MIIEAARRHQQPVYVGRERRWQIGEVRNHALKGNVDLLDVLPVVAGVLLLRQHYADYGVGLALHVDGLAQCIAVTKQLLLGIGAHERHCPGIVTVGLAVEAALRDVNTADIGEGWKRSGDGKRRAVVAGLHWKGTAKLRHDVRTTRAVGSNLQVVIRMKTNGAARARATRLHTGAASENDEQVLAKARRHLLLANLQALAGTSHESDGNHSPCDAKHG